MYISLCVRFFSIIKISSYVRSFPFSIVFIIICIKKNDKGDGEIEGKITFTCWVWRWKSYAWTKLLIFCELYPFVVSEWVSGLKSLWRWRLFLGGGLWWVGWWLGWVDSLCRVVDRTPVLDRTMYTRNEKSYGDGGRKKLGGLAMAPLSFFPWWCCCYIGHGCSNRLRTVNLWEPTWSLDPGPCCGGA